ncbi:hypothetical protein HDU96_008075 [Phlyctochytrium bullatum]|nr:hypothetical protein HDU96_008075 [Phlyctochytrium bullatum]
MLIRPKNIGVALFYMLSGRVLALSYLQSGNPALLASSILRRPIRLGLPAMGASYLHWAFHRAGFYALSAAAMTKMGGFFLARAGDVDDLWMCFVRGINLIVHGKLPAYPVGVQWTIPHEITGSYQIYLLALLLHHFPIRRLPILLFLLLVLLVYRALFAYFLVGLLIADLQPRLAALPVLAKRVLSAVCVTFLVVYWLDGDLKDRIDRFHVRWSVDDKGQWGTENSGLPQYWELVYSRMWAAAAMLVWAEVSPGFQWFLECEPVKFLAKISFGLYLMHPLSGVIFGSFTIVHLLPASDPESGKITHLAWYHALLLYSIVLAFTVLMAWGFYHTMDKLSIDGGRALERWLKAKGNGAATATAPKKEKDALLAMETGEARKEAGKD